MSVRDSTIRRLDRRDGLILVLATIAAILGVTVVPEPAPPPIPPPIPGILIQPPPDFIPMGTTVTVEGGTEWVPYQPDEWIAQAMGYLVWSIDISVPFLTAWTAALWIIRIRRPRPPWRRLIRQPGPAACSVRLLVLAVVFAANLIRWAVFRDWTATGPASMAPGMVPSPFWSLRDGWFTIRAAIIEGSGAIPQAVAAPWLIMALGRWWRPEKSGIDRLGRALGAAWLLVAAADYLDLFLP